MDYTANVANSEIDVDQIRTILVQGDATYPHIQFVLDPSLSSLSWKVRGYYRDFNIAVISDEITPTETETDVTVDWYVSTDFTTYYGEMQLVLVGTDAIGETVVKALGNVLIGRDFSISTTQVITQNLFEQLMAQLTSACLKIDQTLPQRFVGGIPKLAADRVISDDNDLVDKKHVADVVATVTADDFDHNDLANKQGGTAGEYYHMTQAQNSALHEHSNKSALDAVSGTNTGDQNAAGVANTPAGNIAATTVQAAINELDTEKEAVANKVTSISETSTDTQYPSAKCTYGAISTHNNDAGAHADKESKSNKVTSISETSTDTQYPSAKSVYDFGIIIRDGRVYTLRWDKVNSRGVRLNNAQGISTTITNFCHRGTVNAAMDNPFDSIYPWSEINLCNISVDEYRALAQGSDIANCAVSWLGDVDFSYNHENGVYVFRPEHFVRVVDDGPYRYIDISNKEIPGSVKQKARMEGRYFGVPYVLTIDGASKTCLLPKPGMPGKNIAMSTLHAYAKNWGASLENIYGYSDVNALMAVEYATLNSQDTVGNGVSDLYRQNGYTIKAAASNTAVVKILTADASTYCIAGAVFDIGATDGSSSVGSFIIASTALDADPTYTNVTLTTDGTTPASVTVTTAHYWSVHGLYNAIDSAIGAASGYIGANGRCNAYYRGQIAHANIFRYILGAYRKSGNGGIWIANSDDEADAYDALNQSAHYDTGLLLPQGAGGASVGGYIQTLGLHDGLLAPLCTAIGGGSINPVGDYCYVPSLATGDTVLIAGGHANYGASCGRFYGDWCYSAAASYWYYGAVPVLKTPI